MTVPTGIVTLALIIVNVIVSYNGFKNPVFFEKYVFDVERIRTFREYRRIISSGFLHANWQHLLFNMLALYVFGIGLDEYLGGSNMAVIYFASLLGGNLFTYYLHRHDNYRAVGASGATFGLTFASIALFPGMKISLFFLPIGIPSWLFGLGSVLFSIYGIRAKKDNIGHEAHLGGAIVGMLTAICMNPAALVHNYLTIAVITVPVLIFMYIIMKRPHLLLVNKKYKKQMSIEDRYNMRIVGKQKDIDGILEKIHKRGIKSLTDKEREMLDDHSKS
jgi:membrane associated rhomboid family serine protease